MVFVVVLDHDLLEHTTSILNDILGNDRFTFVFCSEPISTASMYHRMTLASIGLHEKMMENPRTVIDMVAIPVLTVFGRFDHARSILSRTINTDTVFFDTLLPAQSPTVMYSSLVASVKILKSAAKIEHILTDGGETRKTPFKGPFSPLFQLLWYAQKIGLKVYEHVE